MRAVSLAISLGLAAMFGPVAVQSRIIVTKPEMEMLEAARDLQIEIIACNEAQEKAEKAVKKNLEAEKKNLVEGLGKHGEFFEYALENDKNLAEKVSDAVAAENAEKGGSATDKELEAVIRKVIEQEKPQLANRFNKMDEQQIAQASQLLKKDVDIRRFTNKAHDKRAMAAATTKPGRASLDVEKDLGETGGKVKDAGAAKKPTDRPTWFWPVVVIVVLIVVGGGAWAAYSRIQVIVKACS